MLKFINARYFLISFFVGLLFMYISESETSYITVYPTKDNKDKFQFEDQGKNCFTLESAQVECSAVAEEIPIQV
jgi:hypothetical protein